MITKKVGNNYICYTSYNYHHNDTLKRFIDSKEYKHIFSKIQKNIILTLGGDGLFLRAIQKFYTKGFVFLGVNFGTVGYLLNKKEKLKDFSKYQIKKYPLLQVSYSFDEKKYSGVCFNEVNITVGDGKVLDLEVLVGKEKYFFRGDGVLVVTPAGSTGYNRSLYGPVLAHNEKKCILTPKAEMSLQKPIIFTNTNTVIIKNIHRLSPIEIYLDGNKLGKKIKNKKIEIIVKKSEREVQVVVL